MVPADLGKQLQVFSEVRNGDNPLFCDDMQAHTRAFSLLTLSTVALCAAFGEFPNHYCPWLIRTKLSLLPQQSRSSSSSIWKKHVAIILYGVCIHACWYGPMTSFSLDQKDACIQILEPTSLRKSFQSEYRPIYTLITSMYFPFLLHHSTFPCLRLSFLFIRKPAI